MARNHDARWIELVNSYGPFNHSPWEGRGVRVSHEEGLEGRAIFLARILRKIITARFSNAELKKMTIVDVGCYDGWILHQLSDLPFLKMIGIEPRKKNILKGEGIRKLLGIKTRVKFKVGDINNLPREKFDIVLCIGVLHHLESAAIAIQNLDKITKKALVIDTICLPEKYLTNDVAADLELKDVIYQNKPKQFGLTGEKYESAYYDGSTAKPAVVTIPSASSLLMNMDILGYSPVKLVAGPSAFRGAMKKNERPFDEVLIYGEKGKVDSGKEIARYIKKYEYELIHDVLNTDFIKALYAHYIQNEKASTGGTVVRAVIAYIDGKNTNDILRHHFKKPLQFEMVKNMRFNPKDKIAFEYAKVLDREKKYEEALGILHSITEKLNADWRVVYRSFYSMHLIYEKLGNKKNAARYAMLCKRCHINFPLL